MRQRCTKQKKKFKFYPFLLIFFLLGCLTAAILLFFFTLSIIKKILAEWESVGYFNIKFVYLRLFFNMKEVAPLNKTDLGLLYKIKPIPLY